MDKELEEELNWFAEDPAEDSVLPVLKPIVPRSSSGQKKAALWIERLKSNRASHKSEQSEGKKPSIDEKKEKNDRSQKTGQVSETKKPFIDERKENDEIPLRLSSSLANRTAKTAEDKLFILDERDKLIRAGLEGGKLEKRNSVCGICPDMCPEKERILRDVRGIVSSYEAYPGSNQMDHSRAVKEYARSSADQDEPLPHELRPTPVLRMTMDYLIVQVMRDLDNEKTARTSESVCYDFCWGRLRAIRKDIIQQQLCDLNTVSILEECARFHICCFDRMWGTPKSVFDDKINLETLMNCLKSLMYMYDDLRKQGKSCPNEAEFRAYMIILKLQQGFVLSEFPFNLQNSAKIKEAVEIHTAYNNNMYSTYFMLVKKTSYLNACIMQRFFGYLRTRAIEVIIKSHCPPKANQSIKLSVSYIAHTLKFDDPEDCISFCEAFGLSLSHDGVNFVVSRNDFFLPETMFTEAKSSSLVANKRVSVAQSVLGQKELPILHGHQVHSSFNDDNSLKVAALDASDQEEKLLRDNVERSMHARKSPGLIQGENKLVDETEMESTMDRLDDDEVPEDVDMSPAMPYAEDEDEIVDEKRDSEPQAISENEEMESDHSDAQSTSGSSTSIYDESLQSSDSDSQGLIDETESDTANTTPSVQIPSPAVMKKTPEKAPVSLFIFPSTPHTAHTQQTNEPVKAPTKSPESGKKLRLETSKVTQKAKLEMENKLLMSKLRKKLSEKMKHVAARKYSQIWKAKVERARKIRENEGVALRHISMENHLKLWGCSRTHYRGKTQERLSKRNRANLLVTALLHLDVIDRLGNEVKQVGLRIAEILGRVSVKWADLYGNISQPQPVFWKLVISLPARSEVGAVFPDKLRYWCKVAFHSCVDPVASDLSCWMSSAGVPVFIHPVIVEGIAEIEKYGQNHSAILFVRAAGWEETEMTEKRLNALKATAKGATALAVLTLGEEMKPITVTDVFTHLEHRQWTDTNALVSSLISLAQKHHMDNFKTLSLGLLVLITVEKFLDALQKDEYLNNDLYDKLTEPNEIISLYNQLIDKLEDEVSNCCFYNYYGLACELEPMVKKLKYAHDIFPSNYNNTEAFQAALRSHTSNLKLPFFPWKFTNSIELLGEMRKFCDDSNCPHLLSRLVRTINPPDSDSEVDLFEYLKDIQWLFIIETVAKERINRDAYQFKVVYREDKVRELTSSHWWLC